MNRTIAELEPKSLWGNFYQLTQIPRPSHHEQAVQNHVIGLGEQWGLEVIRDEHGNVIIRKPATKGMEQRAGVILQGHLDMVPQVNSGISHDFTKDPIKTVIEDDWVKSVNTTLGADNGIGVAAALAVLESKDIRHGPIEALFTSNEEDGMTGAMGLKPGMLQGNILLNMDSEDEGVLSICCAGGANVNTSLAYRSEHVESDMVCCQIAISGLKGGHSGVDIHRGRGNANKLMFRLLRVAVERFGVRLAKVQGGNMRNAIPREAFATVCVSEQLAPELVLFVDAFQAEIKGELQQVEAGLTVTIGPADLPEGLIDLETQGRLIDALCACPHGVMRMSDVMPGMVETSNNLAVVRTLDHEIEILNLVRSSVESAKEELCLTIKGLFDLIGAVSTIDGGYPGWKPNIESPILGRVKEAYQYCFNEEAEVGGIHAGLECGILGANYPDWDMISFGPTIRFPHSPDECVHVPSVRRFWQLLVRTLSEVPESA
ncbi:MAG: cytosol nonspecific dipeptidase [Sedimenticola sp.]|nr:MAG: cytosol nonspecific dipeptidase [Sedimenticola sp.]